MKILFLGDIVGKAGRKMVEKYLPGLKSKYQIDFVIANGENATHGKGLIEHHYQQLLNAGVDCVTLGNHYASKSEIEEYIEGADALIRPYNIKKEFPGAGTVLFEVGETRVRITNLLGRIFMIEEVENPLQALNEILENEEPSDIHIVDFHAETTSEKEALGWAMDGKVSAILGTHTHVQTHDERILPLGTGYISDVGMCGPNQGILGASKEKMIQRIFYDTPTRYEIENEKGSILSFVVLDIDEELGTTRSIKGFSIVDEHI